MDLRQAHALNRFGLGRRGEEPIPDNPESWLLGQLTRPDPVAMDPPATSANGVTALREDRKNRPAPGESRARALFRAQANSTLVHAARTTAPYRERLVWFWTNHFTISLRRAQCAGVAAAYVEEAIRPHVTGPFEDMVLAVMRHPCMLIYLDNINSVGPDSQASRSGRRGLNENLARECLDLHTVSPAAGYTQADVTALARILTGWSVMFDGEQPGFRFMPAAHQPGQHTVMGQTFPPGEPGGIAALRFLARHPSTHRFLATKLVRHFVHDNPPPEAVRQIEGALQDTKGDLGAASRALVGLEAAWQTPGAKLRTPQDLFIAALRAVGAPADPPPDLVRPLSALGQPLWSAAAPDGWPDVATTWATPEMMMRRVDWCYAFAGRLGLRDPMRLAETTLGPLLRPETRDTVARAGSRADAVTLLLTSPEFQRR